MHKKHLQNDQIFDCAFNQIEGQMRDKECSCESCSLRIARAKELATSLRSIAFEDFSDTPPKPLLFTERRQKPHRGKKILYTATGLFAASFIAFIINITLIKKPNTNTERQGQVFFSSGDVQVNGKTVETGYEIMAGDVFETRPLSSAVIKFGNSSIIAMREKTIIKIVEFNLKNKKPVITIDQRTGITFNKIVKDGAIYSIQSQFAIATVRGTAFTFSTNNRLAEIKLLHGKVSISHAMYSEKNAILEQKNSISVNAEGLSDIHNLSAEEAKQLEALDTIEISQQKKSQMILSPEVKKILTEDLTRNSSNLFMTLSQIQKKYGVLNKIELWNGKVYIGAFVRKGSSALIVTPRESLQIFIDDVNKVSEYTLK